MNEESRWECEHCGALPDDISDLAEVNERLKCSHCKKHTVVWKLPDPQTPAPDELPIERQTPQLREASAGNVTSGQCKMRKDEAKEWIARMRQANEEAVPWTNPETQPQHEN